MTAQLENKAPELELTVKGLQFLSDDPDCTLTATIFTDPQGVDSVCLELESGETIERISVSALQEILRHHSVWSNLKNHPMRG